MAYRLTDNLELNASYGRNQIRPYSYVPLVNIFNQNRAAFQAAGVTINDMFSGYDMEISDNFEMGTRFRYDRFEVVPTLFYSKHQNLLTTVYDPRVNLNYRQNVGDATGYGDAEHNEKIDDYVVADLKMGYTFTHVSFVDKLRLSLELTNLFDKEYVSVINASDDSRTGSASYYVGAPFTTLLSVSFDF